MNIKNEDIQRWRVEIEQAEVFRDNNFGIYTDSNKTGVGENIEYFETGSLGIVDELGKPFNASMNLIYTIAQIIVPSLYYRNPKILSFPKRKQDEDSSPVAASLLNYYFNELGIKDTNHMVILDAFLLGMGVTKIGYTTRFGTIPNEDNIKMEQKEREKEKKKSIIRQVGESLGIIKADKDTETNIPQNFELQENIIAENPYVVYVNPFDFLIDPRATSIYDAQWVAQKIRKNVDEVKKDKNLKNTAKLKGNEPPDNVLEDIPATELDKFKTIDLYEIHYKAEDGIYILILAKDGNHYEHLYHDKSIYEMDGFQFELLSFNKHGHKLYPKSDVDIVKPLQDRLNITFDAILDQVDKYTPKVVVNETAITEQGKLALNNGEIGAIVYTNSNPSEVIREIQFTQLKSDMMNLVNQIVDIITIESGLTRAQLTGLSTAQTATEAQIGQGGSNIRLFSKADKVQDFSNRQSRKLWQVIRQFVDTDKIELITGEESVDENGITRYSWTTGINSAKLAKAELRFQIEVGSTQKPDLAVVRKEFENFINLMARTDVIALLQQQGKRLDVGELIRLYLNLYPEMVKDISRVISPIGKPGVLSQEQMQAQLAKLSPGGGQGIPGQLDKLLGAQTPTQTSMQEQIGGEAGQL